MGPEPDLTEKVAFLLRGAFASAPEAIETHLSWVFLTAERVYKLKKPVVTAFLDHRTVEARQADCEAEVALNRPFAPGVYLGTVALATGPDGALVLGGLGPPIVDWLVVMHRIPETWFLSWRLAARSDPVLSGEVESLVGHLLACYCSGIVTPAEAAGHRRRLLGGLRLDRAELLRSDRPFDRAEVRQLLDRLDEAVTRSSLLDGRAERIVDGHGDLRPEHVVLGSRPAVIDRITYKRELRLVDPVYDLALLAVECERLEAGGFGDEVLLRYLAEAADPAAPALVALYRSLRATTRARLSLAHLHDGDRDAARWLDRTDAYLDIALRHIESCDGA